MNERRINGGAEPRPPSSLLEQLERLQRDLAAFDALRWKKPAAYAAACARVLGTVRDVLRVAFPGEPESAPPPPPRSERRS